MTREMYIKKLEKVNMFDVNQYKVDYLKSKVDSFVLKNDLRHFNAMMRKLRT